MTEPGCLRVPLARYPGMNRFVLDWLGSEDLFGVRRQSRRFQSSSVAAALQSALIDSNARWGIDARANVDQWASGNAVALIAGQQVGFAGGPLYTLAKIASLLKMKRQLEAEGTRATVFFWLATEDHDWDEAATVMLPANTIGAEKEVNRQLDLTSLRAPRGGDLHLTVGAQAVPEALKTKLAELYDLGDARWLRDGITFRDSFAELLATVFGNELVLVDALLPELRNAGEPLFDAIRAKWEVIQHALRTRSAELRDAGYTPQVIARDGDAYTLLFRLGDDGARHALDEPEAIPPERTSTSALTRPLLQDFLFRPHAFVGGPSEVAYYAQIAPLYDLLGIPMPRVALRGHALVAPKRAVRAFERYGIDPADVFTRVDVLLAEQEPEAVARVRAIAEEAKHELLARVEQLGELALPADHSLARAFNRSVGHIEYHFDKLAERSIKGLVRKDRERWSAAKELVATLYPDCTVQDRIAAWFAYWCQYDRHLVDRMVEAIEPDSDMFSIIAL